MKSTVHLLFLATFAWSLAAQEAGKDKPIQDNSFLIEEAYNQGVPQLTFNQGQSSRNDR